MTDAQALLEYNAEFAAIVSASTSNMIIPSIVNPNLGGIGGGILS